MPQKKKPAPDRQEAEKKQNIEFEPLSGDKNNANSNERVLDLEEFLEIAQRAIIERDEAKKQLAELTAGQDDSKDKLLRIAAEYDNFRKRSQREKELLFTDVKADTAAEFLPVYDNLERALKAETADEAYKKGVELTMRQLKEIFDKLGVAEIKAEGEPFDPTYHNAVMHIDDENFGKNIVAEVFQPGFKIGERVIRFAMVKVAN